jgi:large subunit ribosomal protein L23
MLKPILTEKSLNDAKEGRYTFFVSRLMTKHQIKNQIESVFNVKVQKVRTIKIQSEKKKNIHGKKRIITQKKKAMINLKGKDTIDLFETKKK